MIVFGVILMALVHTFLNIGMPVILLPILKRYNERLTYGYLSAAIASTVTLVVGALLLLLLIPLSDEFVKAGPAAAPYFETMGIIFKKGSVFAYHLGMALWSIGGVMFVSVLYKSKLIPRPMSVWGIIGYIVLISGSVMELFAHNDIVEDSWGALLAHYRPTVRRYVVGKGSGKDIVTFNFDLQKVDGPLAIDLCAKNNNSSIKAPMSLRLNGHKISFWKNDFPYNQWAVRRIVFPADFLKIGKNKLEFENHGQGPLLRAPWFAINFIRIVKNR